MIYRLGKGHTIVNFMYDSPEKGEVSVEAYFWIQEPDFNNDCSDWDYQGGSSLDNLLVYKDSDLINDVKIPLDIVYDELKKHLRDLDIVEVWYDEKPLCY